jgi:hypothetical protein
MTFTAGAGSVFQSVPEDPAIQTLVARNALPGKPLEFTVSGTGSIPREQQNAQGGQNAGMGGQDGGQSQDTSTPGSQVGTQPGGGIGSPIATPDPLSKYKWWILGGFGLLFVAAAGFLLRKPAPGATPAAGTGAVALQVVAAPVSGSAALLNALKEELFAVESDRISGKISPAEYGELKAALETVLRRALKRSS